MKDLFIVPDIDQSQIRISFTPPKGASRCHWSIVGRSKSPARGLQPVRKGQPVEFIVPMKDFVSWTTTRPYLYQLELAFNTKPQKTLHTQLFGMRTIRVSSHEILVNNQPFYVKGYIRGREAHDHPNLQGLPLTQYYEKNIRVAKAHGFNLVRFHSVVPHEECFEAADRLGIFIHIEPRQYFGKYQLERKDMDDGSTLVDQRQWKNMIFRLRNHPSLMTYCIGNEIRHPASNPQVARLSKWTKKLDPTRLFIDTCAHGEIDRDHVDFDVQHMSYYFPFGKTVDMFEQTQNWLIFGSGKGVPLVEDGKGYRIKRALETRRPVLGHEICHYAALRDLKALRGKFLKHRAPLPWWIDELDKLLDLKGLRKDYPKMREASKRFQFTGWKLGIEAARRSHLLAGFHFLQLSDTELYENCNGIVDCFDDPAGVDRRAFLQFNSDSALLADLPKRTFFEKTRLTVPVWISHFGETRKDPVQFHFALEDTRSRKPIHKGILPTIDLSKKERKRLCDLEISLPGLSAPKCLQLRCWMKAKKGKPFMVNSWPLWVFPNRPGDLPSFDATVQLDDFNPSHRYPQIRHASPSAGSKKLMISNRFTQSVFRHLDKGGDVLMLYRVPETRGRLHPAPKERFYFPATWDRLKGVIWDRGTNLGAFARPSRAFGNFPHDGFMDLQFHGLVNDCDKLVLDDFPVEIDPIMQGVDKASRDRFDVFTFRLREFQPQWTMRKFAYLFELKVGKGRMLMSGFNFTGLKNGIPEVCCMFESLIKYVTSSRFRPRTHLDVKRLKSYLARKGREPRVPERMMTQYWQLNNEPLESDKYWKDAEKYIRKGRI